MDRIEQIDGWYLGGIELHNFVPPSRPTHTDPIDRRTAPTHLLYVHFSVRVHGLRLVRPFLPPPSCPKFPPPFLPLSSCFSNATAATLCFGMLEVHVGLAFSFFFSFVFTSLQTAIEVVLYCTCLAITRRVLLLYTLLLVVSSVSSCGTVFCSVKQCWERIEKDLVKRRYVQRKYRNVTSGRDVPTCKYSLFLFKCRQNCKSHI